MSNLYDAQYEGSALKVVFEAEVNLTDVFSWFRIVDVHINQRYGSALHKSFLK